MNEIRENLIDRMIRIYGFENPTVIDFCQLCEKYPISEINDKRLEILVKCHETYPIVEDEEDDE